VSKYGYGFYILCTLWYLLAFVIQAQLLGEELAENDFLNKEGVYSCFFETGYELTPSGIAKMERGSFSFIRTMGGLFFNEINTIFSYDKLDVEVWNYQDSFRFMNKEGTANFFYNSRRFFYTNNYTTSITAISGSCGKISKILT